MTSEITASKQPKRRGRPFPKGCSGNPGGRPQGARNAATVIAEHLLDGEAEALTRKAIQKAKQGDIVALRLCLDRILPPRRERPMAFALLRLKSPNDAAQAMAVIAAGLASGDITSSEAAELANVVDAFTRVLAASDFDTRIAALEQKRGTHAKATSEPSCET
jgi:Family of unknown function (DUF5681)